MAALALLGTQDSNAENPTTPDCMQGFDWGQRFRKEGELIAARQYLARCAQSDCRPVVQRKCSTWLQEVERDIPSIVVSLSGVEPSRMPDARVFVDGELAPAGLSGRPTEVDPGVRGIRVKLRDGTEIRARIGVPIGVKQFVVRMRPEETMPPPERPRPKPPPAPPDDDDGAFWRAVSYVAFSIAGAALFAGTVTGAFAIDKRRAIEDDCNTFGLDPLATKCTPEESQRERRLTYAAIGCLVASGASAVVGVVPFIVGAVDERSSIALGPSHIVYRLTF